MAKRFSIESDELDRTLFVAYLTVKRYTVTRCKHALVATMFCPSHFLLIHAMRQICKLKIVISLVVVGKHKIQRHKKGEGKGVTPLNQKLFRWAAVAILQINSAGRTYITAGITFSPHNNEKQLKKHNTKTSNISQQLSHYCSLILLQKITNYETLQYGKIQPSKLLKTCIQPT